MAEAHDIGSTKIATKFSTKRPTDKIPITFPTETPEEPIGIAGRQSRCELPGLPQGGTPSGYLPDISLR
jgi:hypothetical protein